MMEYTNEHLAYVITTTRQYGEGYIFAGGSWCLGGETPFVTLVSTTKNYNEVIPTVYALQSNCDLLLAAPVGAALYHEWGNLRSVGGCMYRKNQGGFWEIAKAWEEKER